MIQFLFFAAVALVAWVLYRSLIRRADDVVEKARRARREAETGAVGTLTRDPETGEFRVEDD